MPMMTSQILKSVDIKKNNLDISELNIISSSRIKNH